MRIVLYTHEHFATDDLFQYIFAHVANHVPDWRIAAVRPSPPSWRAKARRGWNKIKRLGPLNTLEILSAYPISRSILRRHRAEIDAGLRALPRPTVAIDPARVTFTRTLNGPDAVAAIGSLAPDLLLQAGAGMIRSQIFTLAPLGMLNIHHGIAPLIKGMNSIAWGLWERRPEWIGATVHRVDEGIDTGDVLAYAPVRPERPGEGVASLFVRATQGAVAQLLPVIDRLSRGEQWKVPPPPGEYAYRSTLSGWRLLALERRLRRQRNA